MPNLSKSQKGQTLIEVLVALAVGVVLIGSLVALGNSSTRRSTLSRQANEATKLAQEGLEIVRYFKDSNESTTIRGTWGGITCSIVATCTWNSLYNTTVGTKIGHFVSPCNPNQWCLLAGDPISGDPEASLLGGVFTRTVEVLDAPPVGPICAISSTLNSSDIKRVTVKVTWDSPTGMQERTAISCLSSL